MIITIALMPPSPNMRSVCLIALVFSVMVSRVAWTTCLYDLVSVSVVFSVAIVFLFLMAAFLMGQAIAMVLWGPPQFKHFLVDDVQAVCL